MIVRAFVERDPLASVRTLAFGLAAEALHDGTYANSRDRHDESANEFAAECVELACELLGFTDDSPETLGDIYHDLGDFLNEY